MGIHKKIVQKIRDLYNEGISIPQLAKMFNLRERTIISICENK